MCTIAVREYLLGVGLALFYRDFVRDKVWWLCHTPDLVVVSALQSMKSVATSLVTSSPFKVYRGHRGLLFTWYTY